MTRRSFASSGLLALGGSSSRLAQVVDVDPGGLDGATESLAERGLLQVRKQRRDLGGAERRHRRGDRALRARDRRRRPEQLRAVAHALVGARRDDAVAQIDELPPSRP